MKLISLGSGSSGNCTLICGERNLILIDCGLSAKRITEALRVLGCQMSDIDALFITHEHGDHIKGLKRLMSAWQIPVYSSRGTLGALCHATGDDYFNFAGADLMHEAEADRVIELGELRITPFNIWHDTAQPFAYRVDDADGSACVMTDCGHYDDEIRDHMLGLDMLLMEANHDKYMLTSGPYPVGLKRRIMSSTGHLSNDNAGRLLSEIISPRLKNVLLGHLSKENNTQALALSTVMEELAKEKGPAAASALYVSVAPQDGLSRILENS